MSYIQPKKCNDANMVMTTANGTGAYNHAQIIAKIEVIILLTFQPLANVEVGGGFVAAHGFAREYFARWLLLRFDMLG